MKKAVLSIGLLAITTILFSGTGGKRVMICHQLGNGDSISIEVDDDAVQAHLDHGDYFGDCQTPASQGSNGNNNNSNNSGSNTYFPIYSR